MNIQAPAAYALDELCALANLPVRTVRYYVQIGLVDRPDGETRAAKYGARHLEQLLLIRKWIAAGLSLDRIRDILHGSPAQIPERAPAPGSVEVRSHLLVAPGVELVVEPSRAGLSPEQLRKFFNEVMAAFQSATASKTPGTNAPHR